ncbi:MAG: AraC family transcriptional regulator [Spirochaetia bacterium]|nr:AraC family transcriptional regulator [Spirochaetia bacterium]
MESIAPSFLRSVSHCSAFSGGSTSVKSRSVRLPGLSGQRTLQSAKIPTTVRLSDIYQNARTPFLQVSQLETLPPSFVEYASSHRHDYFAIFFFLKGSGSHRIDFVEYEIKDGTLFLLKPGQVHSWRFDSEVRGYAIKFSPEFYARNTARRMALFDFPFFRPGNSRASMQISQAESLESDIARLFRERANESEEGLLFTLTQLVLLEIKRVYAQDETRPADTFVTQFEELLEENFPHKRSPVFYARRLGISAPALNLACKHRRGQTCKSIINERTVLELKRLLVHSDMSIAEIAKETNFADSAYMSRFFRLQTGNSPERYRAEIRKVL